MTIRKVHCLFEQSGTFKNEFRKLGYDAEDYDIQNEFGETDNVIDLFAEIDKAYAGEPSIFDSIGECDLVMAFFPCTRFEAFNPSNFQGKNPGYKHMSEAEKIENSMALHRELSMMYEKLGRLFLIALRGGWKMVVENPYTQPHYLTMYFPVQPKLIDNDRSERGDYFKKPTQYWFVNFNPRCNFVTEPIEWTERGTKDKPPKSINDLRRATKRSMISPHYARRFILERIVEESIEGSVIAI